MNTKRPLIAVTGATGNVGRRVVDRLLETNAHLRLVVRDPTRAPHTGGIELRRASSYGAYEEMREALVGVDTVFFIPAAEAADRVEQHRAAVRAIVDGGVPRIVYLSFVDARPDATFTLGRDHWHTEQAIRTTALEWTFLRMNLYMDFIPSMVGADGVIRGPAGDGRLAAVLRDDVAASAAAVLSDGVEHGRTYNLTGPQAFSLTEAAATMSRLTGKPVRFHDETDEEAFASRAVYGAPDYEVRGWVSSYQAIRDGSLARVSPDVLGLTGRPPTSLEEYLRASPDALNHVTRRESATGRG